MKNNSLQLLNLNKLKILSGSIIERSEKYFKQKFLNAFEKSLTRPIVNELNTVSVSGENKKLKGPALISKKKNILNIKKDDAPAKGMQCFV